MKKIKFSKHTIKNSDINLVSKIIRSGWLTHGKYTQLFEASFKKFTKSKYCITVSSCTAGLHLSCLSVGFKKGDEVIVPALSHTATAHAVEYTGARAVFADVEKSVVEEIATLNIKDYFSSDWKFVREVESNLFWLPFFWIVTPILGKLLISLQDVANAFSGKINVNNIIIAYGILVII